MTINTVEEESSQSKTFQNEFEPLWIVKDFFKVFGLVLYGYLIGYMGFSVAWLSIVSLAFVINRQKRFLFYAHRKQIDEFHQDIVTDEATALKRLSKYLPSWVNFPDTERAEWLNELLRQLWPSVQEYMSRLLREQMELNINDALPDLLKGFRFASIDFGNIPLRVGSVKCHKNTARDEIVIDIEIIYVGNCDIEVRLRGFPAGIKDFRMRGHLRVELRPLIKELPLVGCISMYFLQNPDIDYTFTKLGALLHFPGVDHVLKKAIMKQFADRVVLPNKHLISLTSNIDISSYKFTRPIAVVHLEIVEARNLKKSFSSIFGFGMVYVNVSIGNEEQISNTSSNISKPKWNYSFDAPVYYTSQALSIEVMYSADKHIEDDKDEYIGRLTFPVDVIRKHRSIDEWFDLATNDGKKGELHLRAIWKGMEHAKPTANSRLTPIPLKKMRADSSISKLSAEENIAEYDEYFSQHATSFYTDSTEYDPLALNTRPTFDLTDLNDSTISDNAKACLVIYLDSASNLPISAHAITEPSAQVIFTLPDLSPQRSTIQPFTCNPSWGETFNFLLENGFDEESQLRMEIIDTDRGRHDDATEREALIGEVSVSLRWLIESRDMTRNEELTIRTYEGVCFHLKLCLSMYYLGE